MSDESRPQTPPAVQAWAADKVLDLVRRAALMGSEELRLIALHLVKVKR